MPSVPGCRETPSENGSERPRPLSPRIDKVNKGKGRPVNARFSVMCAHYLFDPDFRIVASGWEKGIVEKNVQDSRRRIWLDAQNCMFHAF